MGKVELPGDDNPRTADVVRGPRNCPSTSGSFTGGSTSVRSFTERDLGPYDHKTGYPIGGEAFTLLNAEYQFPLKLADLKGRVVRGRWKPEIDARRTSGFSNLRYAIGAGHPLQPADRTATSRLRREPRRRITHGRHREHDRGVPVQLRVRVLSAQLVWLSDDGRRATMSFEATKRVDGLNASSGISASSDSVHRATKGTFLGGKEIILKGECDDPKDLPQGYEFCRWPHRRSRTKPAPSWAIAPADRPTQGGQVRVRQPRRPLRVVAIPSVMIRLQDFGVIGLSRSSTTLRACQPR